MRRHVERLVRLNHVDVVRKPTATGDHDVTFLPNRKRVTLQIALARRSVSHTPVAAEHAHGAVSFVDYGIDPKCRSDKFCNTFALLMHCIAIKQPWPNTRLTPATFE